MDRAIGAPVVALTTNIVLSGRDGDPDSVPTRPSVPAALKGAPFTTAEANCAGITRGQLRGSSYRRLGLDLYCWVGLKQSPLLVLNAIARRLPPGAAFSSRTAVWLHGLDPVPSNPIEITIPDLVGTVAPAHQRAALPSVATRSCLGVVYPPRLHCVRSSTWAAGIH